MGLTWLANFFVTLASNVITLFAQNVAKRTVYIAAAAMAMLTLTATFVLVVKGLLIGIAWTMPPWAAQGFAMFMPYNLSACIGAYFSAKVARWIYDYQMEGLKLASYVT